MRAPSDRHFKKVGGKNLAARFGVGGRVLACSSNNNAERQTEETNQMSLKIGRMTWTLMLASTSFVALSASAHAQVTASASTSKDSETVTEVVVTGFKKSYADAVRMKRDSAGITDSISSDGLGRFPDLNVGEAIQRLPGIQINREAESRNATINLRGLPGTYARTTINGQAFAEPILDSSTPLGAFNSDIFSAISIIKSPSAADQSGGMSGIIDLQIGPALGRRDGGTIKLAYEANDLGNLKSPAVTLGYNKHITSDLAVFGVVAYKKEKFRRDSINFVQYTQLNALTAASATLAPYYAPTPAGGAACPSGQQCRPWGTGAKATNGVLFPSDNRQIVKYNEGDLWTAAGGVEYRVNEALKVGLSGFYTRRNLDKNYTDLLEVDARQTTSTVTPTGSVFTLADGFNYINAFDYSNAQVNRSFRSEPTVQKTWDVSGNAEYRTDDWRLTGTLVTSKASNNIIQTQIDVRNLAKAGGNGVSGSFFSGNGDIGKYLMSLNPGGAPTVTAGPYVWQGAGNSPTAQNAAGDQLIVAGSLGYLTNELNSAQGDVERYFENGVLSSLVGGARIERAKFESRGYRTSAKGVQGQNVDSSFLTLSPYAGDFFGGSGGAYARNWYTVDYARAVSRLQPVTTSAGDLVTPSGWINDPTNGSYSAFNFSVQNDNASAYLMGKIDTNVFGLRVRGNVGGRYEATEQTVNALNKKFDAAGNVIYVPETFKQKYNNFLPSLMLAADLSDTLVLRGASYKTFVRPQPRNLSPATSLTKTGNGFQLAYGGYDLKPYTAVSHDISLEWYNRANSLVSVDVYHKTINDLVIAENRLSRLCPADATAYGLGHLSLNGTTCQSDILVNGQPAVVQISGNYNQDKPIKVDGVEISIQQNFDFLPGFLKNSGGVFNYSYAKISGTYADGNKAILPGVSKNAFNVIGFYETAKYGARIVYNYRDEYILAGGNTFTGGASRVKARGQLDASLSYTINERFALSFDAYNMTDQRRTQYQNVEAMPRANDYDGRTYTMTLRGSF
jgi:TonB-dependent receptor